MTIQTFSINFIKWKSIYTFVTKDNLVNIMVRYEYFNHCINGQTGKTKIHHTQTKAMEKKGQWRCDRCMQIYKRNYEHGKECHCSFCKTGNYDIVHQYQLA